jgi:hypothetical protein
VNIFPLLALIHENGCEPPIEMAASPANVDTPLKQEPTGAVPTVCTLPSLIGMPQEYANTFTSPLTLYVVPRLAMLLSEENPPCPAARTHVYVPLWFWQSWNEPSLFPLPFAYHIIPSTLDEQEG